jgi:acyl carrier protein
MTASADGIVAVLKSILLMDMNLALVSDQLDASAPLLEEGLGLDSVAIIELIAHVERRFGFQFQDADLRTSTFSSLAALAEVIRRRQV